MNPDAPPPLRTLLDEALRYWEPRRIAYNANYWIADEIYPYVPAPPWAAPPG
jgi:hypothetical protein